MPTSESRHVTAARIPFGFPSPSAPRRSSIATSYLKGQGLRVGAHGTKEALSAGARHAPRLETGQGRHDASQRTGTQVRSHARRGRDDTAPVGAASPHEAFRPPGTKDRAAPAGGGRARGRARAARGDGRRGHGRYVQGPAPGEGRVAVRLALALAVASAGIAGCRGGTGASASADAGASADARAGAGAGAGALADVGTSAGACPDDMVHVATDYCPSVARRCVDVEDDARNNIKICHAYAPSQQCRTREEPMAFCIDRYEYPDRKGAHPATMVSWYDAEATCETRGKRLCWASEWTAACEGPEHTPFPYGWVRDHDKRNVDNFYIDPIRSY